MVGKNALLRGSECYICLKIWTSTYFPETPFIKTFLQNSYQHCFNFDLTLKFFVRMFSHFYPSQHSISRAATSTSQRGGAALPVQSLFLIRMGRHCRSFRFITRMQHLLALPQTEIKAFHHPVTATGLSALVFFNAFSLLTMGESTQW
jgi:hypothetical protein